ncbi:precorrin-3B synthase [Aquabacter sp. CN5-332]|uniref:precorrin-3B synthase n=1 Tax=Aquabacter sp. CN5-332 TaxID=3156608 RepID=UPI0032B46E96
MNAHARRRGACPALSAPMETGDGLLVRLMPQDGTLSPAALARLAAAARDFGNGILEVTARGSLQLRGLRAETTGPLNAAVNALGIRAREGLSIDISPLAGLDATEIADARPLAEAVRAGVAGIAARLGPKVSVVIDGGGVVSLDALKADVRLKAREDGAWDVALAGDAEGAVFLGVVDAVETADVVGTLLEKIAALGPTGRMADVVAAGDTSLFDAAFPLPNPPPQAGEGVRLRPAADQFSSNFEAHPRPTPSRPLSRLRGRVGEGERRGLRTGAPIALTDATFALAIALPFGVADAEMMAALARAAARHEARDLRPAPSRTLLAVGLSRNSAAALARDAERLGFILDPADPRRAVIACPGAPACASGRIAARAMAPQIATALAPLLDGSVTIHVSGCAKGCAHPAPATLVIVGRDEGPMDSAAALMRHGTVASPPERVLAERGLLPALACLAQAERKAGESGADLLSRLDLAAVLEPSS